MDVNTVNVKISGVEYNLKGEEKEDYLHRVAAYVDKKIKNMMDNNSKLSPASAAVLAAVNAVDDLFKCDMAYKELCEEVDDFEKNEKVLKSEIEELKKQLQHMEKHNNELQENIKSINLEEIYQKHGQEISKVNKELEITVETAQKHISESTKLKSENKELKFQLQSSKYKIIDLQNKLIENQVDLAKVKKNLSSPIKNNSR